MHFARDCLQEKDDVALQALKGFKGKGKEGFNKGQLKGKQKGLQDWYGKAAWNYPGKGGYAFSVQQGDGSN